ncbi:putative leader peptide [Streptomyces sp. NPDC059697]|uniref:putative leader peptide n=1 Tax=Streptomyces sp. NPDC059697 TaxID=3346912 RepID=UPI00368D7020
MVRPTPDHQVQIAELVRGAEPRPSRHPRSPDGPHSDSELTGPERHGVLRIVTDTCVRLWRRVHMDLVRYAGCVCRPSC